jgi:hypothetical protein
MKENYSDGFCDRSKNICAPNIQTIVFIMSHGMYVEVGKNTRVCNTLNLFLQNGGLPRSYDTWVTEEHLFPDPEAEAEADEENSETLNTANFMTHKNVKVSVWSYDNFELVGDAYNI